MDAVTKVFNAINILGVNMNECKTKYTNLEGTRETIQFEAPDYTFSMSKVFKPTIKCFGVTNRCEDGNYIFFADYDKVDKELLIKNLDVLIKKFPKSFDNFYIVRTGDEILTNGRLIGSYHVINFVKHPKSKIKKFLEYCDVDPYFLDVPYKTAHKTHVLRLSEKFFQKNGTVVKEKPTFLEVYPNDCLMSGKDCSSPHYKFFQQEWGNPTNLSHEFDDLKKFEMHSYMTPSKKTDKVGVFI